MVEIKEADRLGLKDVSAQLFENYRQEREWIVNQYIYLEVINLSYLGLTKRIMQDELSDSELMEYLDIPNVPVIQQTILKILKRHIKNDKIHIKLLEYSRFMEDKFKILGLYKLGHLSIYVLKQLGYYDDFQVQYQSLAEYDKELIDMLENALKDME